MKFPKEMLSDEEVEKLLTQTLKFHHDNPITEKELDGCSMKIIEWANKARLDACMLDLVLNHGIAVGLDENGELAFRRLSDEEQNSRPRLAEDDSETYSEDEEDSSSHDLSESWKNGNYDPSASFLASQ